MIGRLARSPLERTPMPHSERVEARTQELGRALLSASGEYRPGVAERIEDWLLTHAVADEAFRSRLLRYMDVLASLDYDSSGSEAKRLAREYFGDEFPDLPRPLRWLLRVARNEHLPAPVVGETAERAAELFARRFITPPGTETISRTLGYLGNYGRYPAFDLLGEAVLSDEEAEAYAARYLELIEGLAGDPAAGAETIGGAAMLQVSVKLSSLTAHFSPVDPDGTIARVRPAFEAICAAARDAGVGITVDMEQYEVRDLTWDVFRSVLGRGERLEDWPHAGIVVQGYLRDALDHVNEVVSFAEERGTPFLVRLVKGAYWDYETIVADANRWEAPVHLEKAATDATFEAAAARFIAAHPSIRLAIGSHNARSHAVAEALAEEAGLPTNSLEHQTLFRTYEGMSRGLVKLGWIARDYVPVGELIPGMAYLVRRVLENSSQAGFLLQSRSGVNADELLEAPAPTGTTPPTEAVARFERAPTARWFEPGFRDAFDSALADTRARFGEHADLRADGAALPSEATVGIYSPSDPGGPAVGTVDFANLAATEEAVEAARAGQAAWGATPVAERARILRHASELLEERQHEFAAWVVHEGGRDRGDAFAEVEEAIDYLRYYASEAERLYAGLGERIAPRGVVGVIPPWNFPLAIPCGMTVAALAAGNAAILKPAEQTPLIAWRLVALLHEAGVPRDALVHLAGRGELVGAALAESADVAMIAFTGSRAVGTLLHEVTANVRLTGGGQKALVAEMGGKNPVLVFADADLDEAVAGILRSAFGHANQKCSAASRILIEEPVFERLRDRLVASAASLEIGAATNSATQVNPVIDREADRRLEAAAAIAREECGVLLDLFRQEGDGLLHGPLIVELPATGLSSARTGTEELFGPILVLTSFEDEAEALRLANDTAYGLTAGVFSRSPATIERVTTALEAGNVYVNRTTTGARAGVEPFGGMKMSGTGPKAGGPEYLAAFVRRTDARVESIEVPPALTSVAIPDGMADAWDIPLAQRRRVLERAATSLSEELAAPIRGVLDLVEADLGRAAATLPVAGQQTELRYDMAHGLGVVRASGGEASAWLAAALLGGNACIVVDSPALVAVVNACLEAGVPASVLRYADGGAPVLRALAARPQVTFAALDAAGPLADAVRIDLAGATEGQRSLKALLSPLDGAQPGEAGFLRRFTWPKVTAIRTLRHGADLTFDLVEDEPPN
jgi:RHH-type proline utilization regulon transcriptional repressor/proline dehydrogenase/delta 1-pyrroline-5-carboxylate dehydrogenase